MGFISIERKLQLTKMTYTYRSEHDNVYYDHVYEVSAARWISPINKLSIQFLEKGIKSIQTIDASEYKLNVHVPMRKI